MSLQLTDNFSSVVKNYISNPTKQINLTTTVIRFVYYGSFFLGLFLILMSFGLMLWNPNYRNGNASKKPLVILGYIGIALLIFGLWATINSFYSIVGKINENIRVKKNCSLFQYENPINAVNIIASENIKETALSNLINTETENLFQKQLGEAERPYSGIADSSTNSFTRKQINEIIKPKVQESKRSISEETKKEILSGIEDQSLHLNDVIKLIYKNGSVSDDEAGELIGTYIENSLNNLSEKTLLKADGDKSEAIKEIKNKLSKYIENANEYINRTLHEPSRDNEFLIKVKENIKKEIPDFFE